MAKTTALGGFPSLFRNKKGGTRYQGVLTKAGAKCFEQARQMIAVLTGRKKAKITDADVMEFLARGEAASAKLWRAEGTIE